MIVVDTNVVSELMRSQPSSTVVSWVRGHGQRELYTTAITLAEIGYGIERLDDGHRKESLSAAANETFAAFGEFVLPFDRAAAGHYADIVDSRDRAGLPINGFDAQIAAICRSHGATLAARNIKGFRGTGVDVVDPWEAS